MAECPHCKTPYAEEASHNYCNECGRRLGGTLVMDSGARTQKAMDLIDVHYNLGLVYYKKGQYREALATWEKALARDPDNEMLKEKLEEVKGRLEEGN